MRKLKLGRSTRSIYLSLACLSLTIHLLLAFFCLSILQTACIFPPSSSSSSRDPLPVQHGSRPSPLDREQHQTNVQGRRPAEEDLFTRGGKAEEEVKGRSKLEALFRHPLYNQPRPQMQEDDWLLRVKTGQQAQDEGQEEEDASEWRSTSDSKDYDKMDWTSDADTHPPWLRFHLGITRWELYDRRDPNLDQLTHHLATQRILGAVQKTGGTQLKLVMSFSNYGEAMLKPMKQARHAETNVNLFYFSDFERHNAEIAAFHLDRLLGFHRVPPVVGRLINVTAEISEITTDNKLKRTFFISPAGNTCFYGECEYYCSTEHPVCGQPHLLEVSLAAMLPDLSLAPRRSWRSPWKRSYSRTKLAQGESSYVHLLPPAGDTEGVKEKSWTPNTWEKEPGYCDTVKQTPPYNHGTRLVDLIDMAVLDFLMSNMDRHHYETFESFGNETFLLHLDHGRAFGRHSQDELSILAPLQQCCRIRRSTLLRLYLLSLPDFRLSDVMRESLSQDPLVAVAPLLSEPHLSALDRRLATVLQVVRTCQHQQQDVIFDDLEEYDEDHNQQSDRKIK